MTLHKKRGGQQTWLDNSRAKQFVAWRTCRKNKSWFCHFWQWWIECLLSTVDNKGGWSKQQFSHTEMESGQDFWPGTRPDGFWPSVRATRWVGKDLYCYIYYNDMLRILTFTARLNTGATTVTSAQFWCQCSSTR